MLLIPVWTVYLHSAASYRAGWYTSIRPDSTVLIHLSILTLISGAAYVFNQLFDIESDCLNKKLFFLPQNIVAVPTAWGYYAILTTAGLFIAATVERTVLPQVIIITILGVFYSVPGVRLKDRPIAGLLANAAGYGLMIPWVARSYLNGAEIEAAVPYFPAIAAGYVLTTIPDRDGDAATGKRTVAVILGIRGALWLAVLLSVATMLISIWMGNLELAIAALATAAGAVYLIISYKRALLMMICKFPILLLTAFAAVHFPGYLLILLLTIILTRFYYTKRFGMVYPKLS